MSERVVRDNEAQHRFEIVVDGEVAGYSQYQAMTDGQAFTHTEIDERYEGQGMGSTLVRGLLDEMRRRDTKVLPYCPFVRSWIAKHPQYAELVPAAQRESFDLPV